MGKSATEHWSERARRARELEAGWTGDEPKLTRDRAIAAEVGLSRQSLRNYLMAFDFVERVRLRDPDLAKLMLSKAPAALNDIERAHREVGDKAFEPLRRRPEASTAQLMEAAAKMRNGPRRRVAAGRTFPALAEALTARDQWYESVKDAPKPDAGIILGHHLVNIGLPALPLAHLEFTEPSNAYYVSAGISRIAAVPESIAGRIGNAPRRGQDNARPAPPEWAMTLSSLTPAAVRRPFAAVMELPNYTDMDHYRWSARDCLYRAVAIAPTVFLVIVLLPSPELRDIMVAGAPALPEELGNGSELREALDTVGRQHLPQRESLGNWRLLPTLDSAIVFTCPQMAHVDLFGIDHYAISRMSYGHSPSKGEAAS